MKCKAKNATGQPCKMNAVKGGRYCFTHSPETRAQQAEARRAGGLNRHTPHAGNLEAVNKAPRTVEDTFTILDYALAETLAMDNGIQRNRLLVAIAAGYVDTRKVGDLETQLAELMRILGLRENQPT